MSNSRRSRIGSGQFCSQKWRGGLGSFWTQNCWNSQVPSQFQNFEAAALLWFSHFSFLVLNLSWSHLHTLLSCQHCSTYTTLTSMVNISPRKRVAKAQLQTDRDQKEHEIQEALSAFQKVNSNTWRLLLSITMSLTTLSGITAKGARAALLPFNICRLYHQRPKSS